MKKSIQTNVNNDLWLQSTYGSQKTLYRNFVKKDGVCGIKSLPLYLCFLTSNLYIKKIKKTTKVILLC